MRLPLVLVSSVAVLAAATGSARAGALACAPPNVDFGAVPVLSKKAIGVTCTNQGKATLTITNFVLLGGGSISVQGPLVNGVAADLPISLAPGGSFTFTATFSPRAEGAATDEVDITSDDPMARYLHIPIDGTGVAAPGVQVAPATLAFGSVQVGTLALAQPFNIQNVGGLPLDVRSVALGGTNPDQFAIDDPGSFSLDAGKSRLLGAWCAPTASGSFSATITVTAANLPSVGVMLSCTGVAALVHAVGQDQHDFGDVAVGSRSAAWTVSIRNNGTQAVQIASILAADDDFIIDSTSTMTALPPAQVTHFDVVFGPRTAGRKQGSVAIQLAGGKVPALGIRVSGNGAPSGAQPDAGMLGIQPPLAMGCSATGARTPVTAAPGWALLLCALAWQVGRRRRRARAFAIVRR